MGSFSSYLENRTILHFTNQATYEPPGIFLALCTQSPVNSSTGVGLPELDHLYGYERFALNEGTDHWVVLNSRTAQNLVSIRSTEAEEDWELVTHWALVDSGTYRNGNMLAYGAFGNGIQVNKGKRLHIDPYRLTVQFMDVGATNYAAKAFLNHLFGIADYVPPTALHLGLCLEFDGDIQEGALEPVGNNYVRKEMGDWFLSVDNKTYCERPYNFTSIGGGWGKVTHVTMYDALSGGNLIFYRELTPPFIVLATGVVTIAARALVLILDASFYPNGVLPEIPTNTP